MWMPCINALKPSDAYMRQKTRPSSIQIMACRLDGAKPLSKPMFIGPLGIIFSEILIEIYIFSFKEMHLKTSCKMASILSRCQWVKHLLSKAGPATFVQFWPTETFILAADVRLSTQPIEDVPNEHHKRPACVPVVSGKFQVLAYDKQRIYSCDDK